MLKILLFSLVTNNLTYSGRRHFKLFTNCHVSWDTLYVQNNNRYVNYRCYSLIKYDGLIFPNKTFRI